MELVKTWGEGGEGGRRRGEGEIFPLPRRCDGAVGDRCCRCCCCRLQRSIDVEQARVNTSSV